MSIDHYIKLHRLQSKILSEKLEIYRLIESAHKGRQGKKLEDALSSLLREFLPDRYGVVTGKLVDLEGNCSRQSDIIVYDQLFNAKLIYEDRFDKYIPLEAARCVIEVKSTFNKQSFKQSLGNLASIRELKRSYQAALSGILHEPEITIPPLNFYVFAFDSYSRKDETLLKLLQQEIGTLQTSKGANYLAFFPNLICLNSLGNISLVKDSSKPEHQGQTTKYFEPHIATFGKDDLMLSFMQNKDDSLFYFLIKLLEEADSIPPVKSRFLHFLFVKNESDIIVKNGTKYNFPKK